MALPIDPRATLYTQQERIHLHKTASTHEHFRSKVIGPGGNDDSNVLAPQKRRKGNRRAKNVRQKYVCRTARHSIAKLRQCIYQGYAVPSHDILAFAYHNCVPTDSPYCYCPRQSRTCPNCCRVWRTFPKHRGLTRKPCGCLTTWNHLNTSP